MSRFWSDHLADLTPYVAGEQPKSVTNLLKLNTNEHPYGPSPRALEAIKHAASDRLRLYPDNESVKLRAAIAQLHDLDIKQVFVGNGSDEVLAHIFNGLFRRSGRALLMPDITYSFYRTYCTLYQIPVQLVPLADDFSIRVDDYTQAHSVEPAGIIFSNPNAPTGIALTLDDIRAIAAANPDIPVVVDEAYVDFGAETAIALLKEYDNIVVVHTLSKSRSLAGLRVGFAVADSQVIQGLNRVKDSFNSYPLDVLAQAGAVAALEDTAYFKQMCQAVIDARTQLTEQLTGLGFQVLPSKTNFVFARHPKFEGAALAQALREQNILVRHFKLPRIDQFLRITVGTLEDCERLCNSLVKILEKTY
ncbi:histidinol-phosphate transaminase [Pollutimonas harenae]|uniref:Histidinol-phosphate aminotransferase n=1 Tax=Pollutimonas harenae TaxID=657015 RepID=A0A853H1W9_9BURK|nr:histidinol-phosphate transaminase [Pollutimonas harenae]NYT85789.1 histidinol-phosphate transaminase [Pollutimonas harenae]TEA70854.1 histidinol-phosphate transaminase [Pollutimonas harenae]